MDLKVFFGKLWVFNVLFGKCWIFNVGLGLVVFVGSVDVLAEGGGVVVVGVGWGRVDFIVDKTKKVYIIEINTVPGMTNHSLVPLSAKYAGVEFDDLVMMILETSNV